MHGMYQHHLPDATRTVHQEWLVAREALQVLQKNGLVYR
jgi:uncharacterized membrane protein